MSSASKSRSPASVLLRSVAAVLLAHGGSQALAQATTTSVTLCAEPYLQAVPGIAGDVPMWGYRQVAVPTDCNSNAGVGTASPGPVITVPAGNTALAITLVNKLTVPTSIVIAGQRLPSDGGMPVMAADVVGPTCVPTPGAASSAAANPQNCRVRSFTGETDVGATRTYTFSNLKPGTYLYQSGTHPQVQVQMGLFGMMRQDASLAGVTGRLLYSRAGDANAGFDVDVPVVLSEIDPDQHARIAQTLGSTDPTTWKAGNNSTLNYAPKAFLINGRVFDGTNANDLVAANAGNGSRIVLRIANAGLQSRSLMLNSGTWKLLTEDGNAYPAAREQATALVPAGKTTDAQVVSTAPTDGSTGRSVALFDRRGGSGTVDGGAIGGQVARLAQTGPAVPFIAPIANQVANEGAALFTLQLAAGNITTYSLTGQPSGMTIDAGGLISWPNVPAGTPVPTSYNVTVTGDDADVNTAAAVRNFTLRVNHTPAMAAASRNVAHGSITVAAPGLVASASDPDGDTPLTLQQTSPVSAGTLALNADGSFTWTGSQPATGSTTVTFGVASRDPYGLQSASATVTLNVAANVAPVGGTLGSFAAPGYALTLKPTAGLNFEISVPYQLTAPSPLVIPFATLVNAIDPDGSIDPTSFVATAITKVNPVTGAAIARTGALLIGGSEATAVLSGGNITFTPRRTILNTLNFTGSIDTGSANSAGTYRITYTVRDDQGATSSLGNIFIRVNRP